MASYVGIGADDPNHPLEVEGQVFISNVEQGSATNLVPFEVYSDYTGITGDILEGARQMRLRVTPSGTTTSNVNMDMGIEPTSGSYFYISNPVENATLGSNTAFRIVQAGHVEIGSNLSVSGNVVASNIIGGSPLTLSSDTLVKVAGSGGLSVTGPLNVDGTVTGTSATYSGQVQAATVSSTGHVIATGSLTGASATVSGQVQGATISSTGQVVATGSLTGASATVTGQVQAATVSSTGVINGASATVTGQVQAATVSSTGVINGASATVTGDVQGASASLGAIDGSSLAVSGGISASNMSISTYIYHTGDTNTYMGFVSPDTIVFNTSGSEKMRIRNTGLVGIGTASPGTTLDVNGTVRGTSITSTGGIEVGGALTGATTGSFSGDVNCPALSISDYIYHTGDLNTYMGFINADDIVFNTNGAERMRIENTGDIGINTTNPTAKLDVNGDAKVGTFTVTSSQTMPDIGSNSAKLQFVLSDDLGVDTWANYADNYTAGLLATRLTWDLNGSDLMRLQTGGNLYVDGNYFTFSDYRIKENVQSIDDDYAMGVIRGLDPKSYTWKDKEKGEGTEYGFLAQEVKALYPEMVSTGSGTIPMDQRAYPSQITSDTTMEITVSDGSTWTSGDKIAVNDSTNYRHTLTVHEIQNSVLSLTAETISSNMVDSKSETYIYGKEVDDLHGMKVSYLDPLMISALQQLDRRVAALENR